MLLQNLNITKILNYQKLPETYLQIMEIEL